MQEILKQKSKNKKPKTFGIDKYFHKIYDNIIQINDKCYILR